LFIRHSRELGFPLPAIRELLRLADHPEQTCTVADRIAREQLEQVERRIGRLVALREELNRMIAQCAGGQVADCRVIEVLADHHQCLHSDHCAS
jgi:DNA-binding transcriptional MerR regulator